MWSLLGNSGTNPAVNFLGTTDNQPLLLKANGFRGLGLYPTVGMTGAPYRSVNLIGGADGNLIDSGVAGAVIAGGGYFDTSLNGNYRNSIYDNFCAIGGGAANTAGNNDLQSGRLPLCDDCRRVRQHGSRAVYFCGRRKRKFCAGGGKRHYGRQS